MDMAINGSLMVFGFSSMMTQRSAGLGLIICVHFTIGAVSGIRISVET